MGRAVFSLVEGIRSRVTFVTVTRLRALRSYKRLSRSL